MIKNLVRVINQSNRHLSSKIYQRPKRFNIKKWFFMGSSAGIIGSVIYDGISNDFEVTGGVQRFLRCFKIAVMISADYSWNLNGLNEDSEEYDVEIKKCHLRSANLLLKGCLENGGLYIKVGQGISAINHILPPEYTDTLKQLQDNCLSRKPDEVKKLFLEDFGKAPEELFAEFNYEPIAAASLAQVFRAKTHDGNDVAVKVQYIDLQKRFRGDLGTILFMQSLVAFVHKDYNFGWILIDVKDTLQMELDFVNEAKNAERCAKDLQSLSYVYVPKVFWNLTKTRVLTADFIEGCKISETDKLTEQKFSLADIDEKLFKAFAMQIFQTGFVHADPHPGNVFVRKNKKGKPEIVLLDHGLYESMPKDMRYNLCRFWEAIVLKNEGQMIFYANALGVNDHHRFAEVLMQRPINVNQLGHLQTKYSDADLVYIKKLAKNRFDLIMGVLKAMPRNLLFVVRNLNTIRAIAREHGDVVDRPRVMARAAINSLLNGGRNIFTYLIRKIHFEYRLWRMTMHYWAMRNYLKFLTKIGRSPDTSFLFEIHPSS